jgi:hypothetical protein
MQHTARSFQVFVALLPFFNKFYGTFTWLNNDSYDEVSIKALIDIDVVVREAFLILLCGDQNILSLSESCCKYRVTFQGIFFIDCSRSLPIGDTHGFKSSIWNAVAETSGTCFGVE